MLTLILLITIGYLVNILLYYIFVLVIRNQIDTFDEYNGIDIHNLIDFSVKLCFVPWLYFIFVVFVTSISIFAKRN